MLPSLDVCKAAESCCQGGIDVPPEMILSEAKAPQLPRNRTSKVSLDSPFDGLAPIEEEQSDSPVSPLSLSQKKMAELRHMEIDFEITRGIPLHRALRHTELWTSPQEIHRKNRSSEVWNRSTRVSSLDIFVSHTWRTKGRWKILALILQTGWLHGLLAWSLGLAIMLSFRFFDVVSDPWENVTFALAGKNLPASLTPWTIVVAELALMIGLALSPYLPFKTDMSFLDVACIHQGQDDLFERGIYSIGGCLSVTKELLVLYAPEYLSSLWCVFEIVGFRKVNPKGKLNFSPLFIERSTVMNAVIMFFGCLLIPLLVAYTDQEFRRRYIAMLYLSCFLMPIIFVVHTMRHSYREKRQLIFDLNTFDVDNLFCTSDSDRAFILSAIDAWYGSREAFNAFVRSDLREELLSLLPSPHLPPKYAALILSSQMAWVLDMSLTFYKAGYEIQDVFRFTLASFAFHDLWFWFALNGIFYLSDRNAPAARTGLLDWMKTLLLSFAVVVWVLTGFYLWLQAIRPSSIVPMVCFVAFCMLLPCLIFDVFKRILCYGHH